MRLFAIFALALPLACAGADAVRIEGQVFVTQKDRKTVKMSSVSVRIVERKYAAELIEGIQKLRRLEDENDDLRRRSFRLVEGLRTMKTADAGVARKTLDELRGQFANNDKEIQDLRTAYLTDRKTNVYGFAEAFQAAKWNPAKTVQTDPEGVFSTEMPSGEWFLVAWASRQVDGDPEKYLWMLQAKPGERNLLNNSNLYLH